METSVGVIVGRFHVAELHAGHLALLDYVASAHKRTLIIVGVRPAESSDTNPLSFESRKVMLSHAYPKATILPAMDMRDNGEWSKQIDRIIQSAYGFEVEARFHVGRNSFAPSYSGKYPIEEHSFGLVHVNGAGVRQEIKTDTLETAEARLGAIHAIMNLPHRFTMMVDMFMVKHDGEGSYEILFGRKDGEVELRLPGGHVDPGETFKQAASREMNEETSMILTDGAAGWKIVADFDVPDWRVRDTDRITYRTILLIGEYSSGRAESGDDLAEVRWIAVNDVKLSDIVEEHRHLVTAAMEFLKKDPPFFLVHRAVPSGNLSSQAGYVQHLDGV